jgi:adenylosuccinate synthase
MPVTVVVGGQFGSEGKGKVAHALAVEEGAAAAVRVGGPNSGHTIVDRVGNSIVFRQLPTACIEPNIHCVLPPGACIREELLLREIDVAQLAPSRLSIDPFCLVISDGDVEQERTGGLIDAIGSTGSGTGSAIVRRALRRRDTTFAKDLSRLQPYIRSTCDLLARYLGEHRRVLLEGTQGFGLSPLHSGNFPYVTSRDTTVAAFLSEAGLSPLEVDQVVLVIRAFPIRVAGNSGPLPRETTWKDITATAQSKVPLSEFTSVTKKLRRVARFDADVVRKAILVNRPSRIVLNHVDYVDANAQADGTLSPEALRFIEEVEAQIGRSIDDIGFSPRDLVKRHKFPRKVPSYG